MNFISRIYLQQRYKKGKSISKFIAHDLRKDIFVVDNSEIVTGYLTIKERIFDVRMLKKHDFQVPQFSLPKKIKIRKIWKNPFDKLFTEN